MSVDRWDPLREVMTLRDAVDRLFQQSVVRPGSLLSSVRPEAIPLDIIEREGAYVVRASIPGVDPDDLQVTVQGDTLTIRGEVREQPEERPGETWLVREHRAGALQRSITLPAAVDSSRAEARCEHGVLTLTLPKAEEARPRRIQVGGMAAQRPAPNSAAEQAERYRGDRVTEASAESFPASDPPAWTPEKA